MKFREGDKVEFIWLGKLIQGVVTEIEETKNAISYQIKYSGAMGMTWLDEKELIAPTPVLKVPQFADDWIKHCEQREYDLACLLDYEDSDMSAEMYEWLISSADNQELLARAWLDGYEVEKEPKCESEKLYIIEIDKNYMFSRIWIRSFETIAKELQYTIAHSKEEALSGDKLSMTTFACFLATHNSRHTYTVVPFNDSEGEA
ncbi:DUF1642 domain-containing protein [Listeria monocytogenes]|nr:DUF1642 domain-containing protein [Listeria monocytogenes]EAC8284332.1 DUF1642 domain-containing protein [Listeria monocytogenes]EAD0399664.1 DUF1642 domain-containing protein [Listeria monocytogenes]EAD0416853.1 DUF1642 domain-containing protein [Listeria monocytogenes]EID4293835.1 DUF1642 domain-containing protein [Listeria monocytogenes]